jgi:hypothetical protein
MKYLHKPAGCRHQQPNLRYSSVSVKSSRTAKMIELGTSLGRLEKTAKIRKLS